MAAAAAGPFAPLDHGGGDVLAAPAPPLADTTVAAGIVPFAVRVSSREDPEGSVIEEGTLLVVR